MHFWDFYLAFKIEICGGKRKKPSKGGYRLQMQDANITFYIDFNGEE